MDVKVGRKKSVWIAVASAVLAGLCVYGIYVLQLRHLREVETVRVVVPKHFVPVGVLLTPDMLAYRAMLRGEFDRSIATRFDQVTGRETVVPLGAGEAVRLWKLDKFRLAPSRGEMTFQIPKECVLSVPNAVRAGDRVRVYASGDARSGAAVPRDVVVASVRSSGNVEIDDPEQPSLYALLDGDRERLYASRREANGPIDQINLNLTEDEWLSIDRVCRSENAKLVIAFVASSLDDISEVNS